MSDTDTTTASPLAARLSGGTGMFSSATRPVRTAIDAIPGPRAPRLGRPATDKQRDFIRKLLAERAGIDAAEAVRETLNAARQVEGGLTSKAASSAIDILLAIPKAAAPVVETEVAEAEVAKLDSFPIQPGRYTLVNGVDGHRTFRVGVQASDDKFCPGQMLIEFLSGPDNGSDYTTFGFVKPGPQVVVWSRHRGNEALVQDLASFLAADLEDEKQVLVTVQCARCGDDLTVPQSIRQGYGPTCVTKGLR